MTPHEARALLSYASSLDPRVRRNDRGARNTQVTAWANVLAPLDLDAARVAIERYYARPDVAPILPGDVAARCAVPPPVGADAELDAVGAVAPDDVSAYLRALRQVRGSQWPAGRPDAPTGRSPVGEAPVSEAVARAHALDEREVCFAWLSAWRAGETDGCTLPPLRFSTHLAADAAALVRAEPDRHARTASARVAGYDGVCLCGRERADDE